MIVEPCIDARPEHLVKQVMRVLERMHVNAIAEGEAICDDVYLVRSKVVSDQVGDCPRNASVCGRILGMCRSVGDPLEKGTHPPRDQPRVLFARSRGTVHCVTDQRARMRARLGLPAAYPKDPADRIIAATAMVEGLPLLTADREIRRSRATPHDLVRRPLAREDFDERGCCKTLWAAGALPYVARHIEADL
jgi:predicted nucleic acid-binding protein